MVAFTRKLGLGVMGWADMLAQLHIHYDSEEALKLADRVMSTIDVIARDTSIRIAKQKGPYPGFDGKTGGEPYECRNSTRTCIAPTGSIYLLAGADGSGIEPHFALETERLLNAGVKEKEETIVERVKILERCDGFIPKTTNAIDWKWHVRHQAAFQKHTNLAVSKTINLPNSATREDVAGAYEMMWRMGCKGGTIFRDRCRAGGEQVLKAKETTPMVAASNGNGHAKVSFKLDERVNGQVGVVTGANEQAGGVLLESKSTVSCRRKPPKTRNSLTHHVTIGDFDGYLHAGMYEDGSLCEIFLTTSKEGSTVRGMLDSWAIAMSHALQYGDPLEDLVRKYSGVRFEPSGITHDADVQLCTSIVDYVVRWLDRMFGHGKHNPEHKGHEVESGQVCPDCHGPAIFQGGCLTCKKQ